jgi:hypothetical protein
MKKSLSTISILLVFSALINAQSNDSLKFKRVTVTTSLFDYIPNKLNASNYNIGTEIYLKNKKSIGINIGLIKSNGPAEEILQISSLNTQGIKIQLEGKHYFNKRKIVEPAILLFWLHIFQYKTQNVQNAGYYLATNISYQNTKTDREENVIDYIDDNPFPNSQHYKNNIYMVNRNVFALNIKFGYQCIKQYGLTIDYAIGLGAQYISSSSTNRIEPNSDMDFPWKKMFDSGVGIYPSFIYQLKLGWAF